MAKTLRFWGWAALATLAAPGAFPADATPPEKVVLQERFEGLEPGRYQTFDLNDVGPGMLTATVNWTQGGSLSAVVVDAAACMTPARIGGVMIGRLCVQVAAAREFAGGPRPLILLGRLARRYPALQVWIYAEPAHVSPDPAYGTIVVTTQPLPKPHPKEK